MTKKKEKEDEPEGPEPTTQTGPDPQSPSDGEPKPKAEPVKASDVPVEGKIAKVEGTIKKDGENDKEEEPGEEGGGIPVAWLIAGVVAIALAGVVLWYYLRHNAPDGTGADGADAH